MIKKISLLFVFFFFSINAHSVYVKDGTSSPYYSSETIICTTVEPSTLGGFTYSHVNWNLAYNPPRGTCIFSNSSGTETGSISIRDLGGDCDWAGGAYVCADAQPQCEQPANSEAGSTNHASLAEIDTATPFCTNNCELVVSEYFQDLADDTWFVSWQYSGNNCPSGSPSDPVPTADPMPDPEKPDIDVDSDTDGIPNYNDDDIDGDGTPNSTDPDVDGDGILNEDDPTPTGWFDDIASEASHSDDCLQRPSCAGDAIQCAQLYEIWRLRCLATATNDNTGLLVDMPDATETSILTTLDSTSDTVADGYETEVTDSLSIQDDLVFDTASNNFYTNMFHNYTCSTFTMTLLSETVTVDCSETAIIRVGLGFLFAVWTVIVGFQILTARVDR